MSAMALRLAIRASRGEFEEAMKEIYLPISEAATSAIRDAAAEVKARGRADIASAGFGRRWQNALRVDAYPRGNRASANAAAEIYHKIPYAGVFEEGATIRGKPRLWIPLSHAPKKIGRRRMSVRNFRNEIGSLQMIRRGGKPLLAAKISMTKKQARTGNYGKVTIARLRKGAEGGSTNVKTFRHVPLFVGVSSIKIRKRFNIGTIVMKAADGLAELYMKHLQER